MAQWSVQVRTEAHRESTAWVPHYISHNSILALHAEIHTSHLVHVPASLSFPLTVPYEELYPYARESPMETRRVGLERCWEAREDCWPGWGWG